VPAPILKIINDGGPLKPAYEALQKKLNPDEEGKPPKLIEIARTILHDCSTFIMVGNKLVYAELAQCCADFVHALGNDKAHDPARLAAFQARYTEGDPEPDHVTWGPDRTLISETRGGQGMLRGMVEQLYQAMFEKDPKKRAELILHANAQG